MFCFVCLCLFRHCFLVGWCTNKSYVIATSDLWLFIHASSLLPSTPHPTPLHFITVIAFHFQWLPMINLFTDLVFSRNCPKQTKLVHINKEVLMWSIALLIVLYCTSAFSDGMPSLMNVPTGWDKCSIILFLSLAWVRVPRGDVTKSRNGGLMNHTVTVQDQSIHSINTRYRATRDNINTLRRVFSY